VFVNGSLLMRVSGTFAAEGEAARAKATTARARIRVRECAR
jgi:hypothetical protein